MSDIVKGQHYVPRSYLKNFCIGESEQVSVYDFIEKKVFSRNIKKVAQEKFFYDLPPKIESALGSTQFLEKFFQPFETKAAIIRDQIIAELKSNPGKASHEIGDQNIVNLSIFIILQYFRTKEFRLFYTEIAEKSAEYIARIELALKYEKNEYEDLKIKFNESYLRLHHAKILLDAEKIVETAQRLGSFNWKIISSDNANPFITADNPVAIYPHKEHPILSNGGLMSDGIEFIYPISPNYLLSIYDQIYFSEEFSNKATIEKATPVNVKFYNAMIALSANRQIYASEDIKGKILQDINPISEDVRLPKDRILINGAPAKSLSVCGNGHN